MLGRVSRTCSGSDGRATGAWPTAANLTNGLDPAVLAQQQGSDSLRSALDRAPPLEDGFVGLDGRQVRMGLAEGVPVRFEAVAPVRAFPSFKRQRYFPGLWWSATTRRRAGYESWLERDHLTPTTPSTYLPQIADYIRRDPAPSDYLRTATTPLPWDQPENRPTRLSRPLSRSERDRQRRSKARRPQPQTAPAYKK